jgi:hypothetical protein
MPGKMNVTIVDPVAPTIAKTIPKSLTVKATMSETARNKT